MNENVKIVFGLIGGLALFLYGMNSMSDALQKAAGEKMKKILGFLTSNPIMGALAGALVTAILQSSSATTVMVIGFVSAGLMNLPQAISVIFGANIGTTMTAQLIAFKLSDYIYPIIFVGFIINFIARKEKVKNIGLVILSFGILFEGIEIMGTVMKPLASSPVFIHLMGQVKDIPVLGLALGCAMTLVVQSSSATIAVLQNFASQAGPDGLHSVIGLTGAIPILLGDNIGTTITALLASISGSKNAKRTAIAHSLFNISGAAIFVCIIPVFSRFVRLISPKGPEIEVISRQIANAHTSFNVVMTLVWLPLIPLMVKIVTFIIRGEDREEEKEQTSFKPRYLENGVLEQPVAAMYLVSQEIHEVSKSALHMISAAKRSLMGRENEEKKAYRYGAYRELFETVHQGELTIAGFISRMFADGRMTETQSEQAAVMLTVINNIGRIAERCEEIVGSVKEMKERNMTFSEVALGELAQCFNIAEIQFARAIDSIETGNQVDARKVSLDKKKMRKALKGFRKAHLARVKDGTCSPSMTEGFTVILYSLERITDNCAAIAEETMDHFSMPELKDHELTPLPQN